MQIFLTMWPYVNKSSVVACAEPWTIKILNIYEKENKPGAFDLLKNWGCIYDLKSKTKYGCVCPLTAVSWKKNLSLYYIYPLTNTLTFIVLSFL